MTDLSQFSKDSQQRIADVVRRVEKMPPAPTQRGQRIIPHAKQVRWGITATTYDYPTYPSSGPVYAVKLGELIPSVDPPYPGATITKALTPYDPAVEIVATDSEGNSWTEGSIVRVERHDGRWWIRPKYTASGAPFVYLTSFDRKLNTGTGSPGTNQISGTRSGSIYFEEVYNDPELASLEILTEDVASYDDPAIRITEAGFYRLGVDFGGDDVTSFNPEDYYATFTTTTTSSHTHDYKFYDTWHHAKPILYVQKRPSGGGSWGGSWIMYVTGNREVFGGRGNGTTLTGGSWNYGTMRGVGWQYFNFDAGDELKFNLYYSAFSGITSSVLMFEIFKFDAELTRIGDQVTPTTLVMP